MAGSPPVRAADIDTLRRAFNDALDRIMAQRIADDHCCNVGSFALPCDLGFVILSVPRTASLADYLATIARLASPGTQPSQETLVYPIKPDAPPNRLN
jgi:hypothetical protein